MITVALLALPLTPAIANADQQGGVDWRQAKQQRRVGSGIQSGALPDGELSNREIIGLNGTLGHPSRFIHRQKHDSNIR